MITLNVKSLYTSISLEDAKQMIENTLDLRVSKYPPTSFLLELAEVIMEKNILGSIRTFTTNLKR